MPTGHIVYARANTLMAAAFDRASLTVTGSPITVVDGVLQAYGPWVPGGVTAGETGAAQFAVSPSGSLVYVPGPAFPEPQRPLVWVDRRGNETVLPTALHNYLGPRISPDGRRFVVYALGFKPAMWIFDFANRTFAPTTPESDGFWPIWNVDGTGITFGEELPSGHVASMRLDGTGTDVLMNDNDVPGAWSPDGSTLVFTRLLPSSGWEMREWSRERGDRRLLPPSATPSLERYPTFSPDGRWLAYASNDSGRDQVYVRAYPGMSTAAADFDRGRLRPCLVARRSRALLHDGRQCGRAVDGRSLRYRDRGGDRTATCPFQRSVRHLLAHAVLRPAPDGQHFVMVKFPPTGIDDPVNTQIAVVLNWFDELKRLAPASSKQ